MESKSLSHEPTYKDGVAYNWATSYNRIRSAVKKASEQFISYDPSFQKARVLVISSTHFQLNFKHFESYRDKAVIYGNEMIRDFNQKGSSRIQQEYLNNIDLVLWLQVNNIDRKTIYQIRPYIFTSDKTRLRLVKKICEKIGKIFALSASKRITT